MKTLSPQAKYDLKDLNQKLRATDEVIGFIATLSSKIVQEECIKKVSETLKLRESLLVEQLSRRSSEVARKTGSARETAETKEIVIPARHIEIEALKILINGVGENVDDLLEIGAEHFRFDDTRKLYEIIREEFKSLIQANKKINFPLEISSNKLEGDEIKKLYNQVIFSPINYSDYNLAEEEVYNNLKRLHINEEIDKVKSQLKKFENYEKQVERLKKQLSEKGEVEIKNRVPPKKYDLKELLLKEEKIEKEIMKLFKKLHELEVEKRNFPVT